MKVEELGNMSDDSDVLLKVERLKIVLENIATGKEFDPKEFNVLRKFVLGLQSLNKLIPKFLSLNRTADEFWGWIKDQSPQWAPRRKIIREAINPILEFLEYEAGEGALEFQKNYEEKGVIGQGGFGLVYLYEHRLLRMLFAVKVFAPAFYEGKQKELERFFQEARMLFLLDHPSIIKIYDAGLIGSRPFIRMEYFQGKNLNEILTERGPLSAAAALMMMKNIVSAIRHAHEKGVIHRDLKPSNLMAARPAKFRVIDFGLSIFIENELHSRLTKTGEKVVGGFYNAPELVENPRLVDRRSDIYSLGAIWFTMLTGQPPVGSAFMDQLKKIDGVDVLYFNSIDGCLKHIEKRTESCAVLLAQIEALEAGMAAGAKK